MNTMLQISEAIGSVNDAETETSTLLGFFAQAARAGGSRRAPVYGPFSRRRARARRTNS